MADTPPISTSDQEDESPSGLQALWSKELSAAREAQKTWWLQAEKIVKRYVDERGDKRGLARLNLFTANTQTMEALLFGKTPDVGVERRFADSQDDEARVASEMLERILNTDIERDDDTQQEALRNALRDRLLTGLGIVWCRYDMGETVMVPGKPPIQAQPSMTQPPMSGSPDQTQPPQPPLAEAVPDEETRPDEAVALDYVYWKDYLYSPCRTFSEMRWAARAAEMSEADYDARFPGRKDDWTANRKNPASADDATKVKDPLDRCIVWEVWSKEKKSVYWFLQGAEKILDSKEDPLELANFWPFPRPMFANLTTSKLLPTPDFVLAQDLYEACDELFDRISMLEDCMRVAGVYDKNNEELKRLVSESGQNEMIGVDNWAAFAEKGGVKGVVDWLPIEQVSIVLDKLNAQLTVKIGLLFQITGMSDIMRGQASTQTTATEQAIKARFASVRVQTLQDEFARFASDTQKIKAEIISKHFSPQTILDRSNILRTPDAQLAQSAVALIQQPDFQFRISVNPDSVSLQDFAAIKQERTEFAQTLATYFQGMMPMIQMLAPVGAAAPAIQFSLSLGQALCAGLKGANEMEGIFDQFIAELKQIQQQQAAQPPQPPPPDPKVEAAKVKAGAEQFKAKADVQKTGMDLQVAKEKHAMDMQKMQMEHIQGIQSAEAKARADAVNAVNTITKDGPT